MSRSENSAKISHFLGIDWGRSDVGLALADKETRMAFIHKTLKNDKNLMQNLAEIIAEKDIDTVIIGIPSYVNSEKVEYEGERLGSIMENNFKVKAYYQNEMFTTKMAQSNLIEKGVKGIKKYDDQEAARIILQEWLDINKG
ncbi:putative Holliday junction resolvase [bacterium BMS3Abin15]|nr:putative Holliday junction resolvase [bacterium BMS3Abin15]HDZ85179.1 Holliday junction resolvase RuvX [Candidatus Moranbacteria bacterium]